MPSPARSHSPDQRKNVNFCSKIGERLREMLGQGNIQCLDGWIRPGEFMHRVAAFRRGPSAPATLNTATSAMQTIGIVGDAVRLGGAWPQSPPPAGSFGAINMSKDRLGVMVFPRGAMLFDPMIPPGWAELVEQLREAERSSSRIDDREVTVILFAPCIGCSQRWPPNPHDHPTNILLRSSLLQ